MTTMSRVFTYNGLNATLININLDFVLTQGQGDESYAVK